MKRGILVLFIAVMALGITSQAQATTLLQEDFNTWTWFDWGTYTKSGVPTTSNGADNDWYGARFESGEGSISSDIATTVDNMFSTDYFARFKDDAGILINVPTSGYESVTLGFDWRTESTDSGDMFRAGYLTQNITGFSGSRTQGFDKWKPELGQLDNAVGRFSYRQLDVSVIFLTLGPGLSMDCFLDRRRKL